jgi:dinuclear metal center YbgI/SA1388 family protein
VKLNDLLKVLEGVAPLSLSDEFCKKLSAYDNSGIIIDCKKDICGVLFSLDLSPKAVERATELGYNLIVTHHPAIYGGIKNIQADGDTKALFECVKRGISVISMHLNFDSGVKGIDYYLMKGLGGHDEKIMIKLSQGGYGRVYSVDETSFFQYVEDTKLNFSTQRVICYGGEKKVKKVASFCGAGCDEEAIEFATQNNADVFVSADLKHHHITALMQRGINIIQLTHYASETYGFGKIYNEISAGLKIPSTLFIDGDLM